MVFNKKERLISLSFFLLYIRILTVPRSSPRNTYGSTLYS
nr:MAG TPA: hypothetical protein [Caudoviricetes sp.]